MEPNRFFGITSTGWTAISSIITAIALFFALFIPIFQKWNLKRRIKAALIKELQYNYQCLQHGIETKFDSILHFRYITSKEWERYQHLFLEYSRPKVYRMVSTYYGGLTRLIEKIKHTLEESGNTNNFKINGLNEIEPKLISEIHGNARNYLPYTSITIKRIKWNLPITKKIRKEEMFEESNTYMFWEK